MGTSPVVDGTLAITTPTTSTKVAFSYLFLQVALA